MFSQVHDTMVKGLKASIIFTHDWSCTTSMNKQMPNLLAFIENNMSTEIDTELWSKVGYVSHAKLYREFYNMTGHSVKEYIRKRRLSNALALIKSSDMGFTDIAIRCGYSSHQTFCRAVKQALGITPSEYKGGSAYYFFPPAMCKVKSEARGELHHGVTVQHMTIPDTLRMLFYHPQLRGIEDRAINALLQAIPDYNGRIFGRSGKQKQNLSCYELYLSDTDTRHDILNTYGFEGLGKCPAITATFATLTVRNIESEINAAWDFLYANWLQGSMFEHIDIPYFEEYHLVKGKPRRLKLYLPIRKRSEILNISVVGNPGLRFIIAKAKGYNAERIASKTVIDYLTTHFPYMIKSTKEMYLHKNGSIYTCGVRVNFEPKADDNVMDFITSHEQYTSI